VSYCTILHQQQNYDATSLAALVPDGPARQTERPTLGVKVAMGSRPVVVREGQMPRTHRPLILFGALWIYALTFGFVALAGIRLLILFMDVSRFRTVVELAIMVAAALAGTYLYVPALKITRRFWQTGDEDPTTTQDQPVLPYHLALRVRGAERGLGR
jgi:hypothetical protein